MLILGLHSRMEAPILTGVEGRGMKASEIHVMSVDQIREELETARENLFNLRFQFSTGQMRNNARLGQMRREIARLSTILRAKQLRARLEQGAE